MEAVVEKIVQMPLTEDYWTDLGRDALAHERTAARHAAWIVKRYYDARRSGSFSGFIANAVEDWGLAVSAGAGSEETETTETASALRASPQDAEEARSGQEIVATETASALRASPQDAEEEAEA